MSCVHTNNTQSGVPPTLLPFPHPIEEFLSDGRWKMYDHQPYGNMSLMDTMDAALSSRAV